MTNENMIRCDLKDEAQRLPSEDAEPNKEGVPPCGQHPLPGRAASRAQIKDGPPTNVRDAQMVQGVEGPGLLATRLPQVLQAGPVLPGGLVDPLGYRH